MTIQEIKEKSFDSARKGYRPEEVDDYLKEICTYIDSLQKENKDMRKKLEVLAAKVEEYRKDEESIQEALLGAQKLGKSIVSEAKEKAEGLEKESKEKSQKLLGDSQKESDRILAEAKNVAQELLRKARAEAEKMITEAKQSVEVTLKETKYQIEKEQGNLLHTQREVSQFKSQLLNLYRDHIDLIKKIPEMDEEAKNQKEKESRDLDKKIYEQQAETPKAPEPVKEEKAAAQKPEAPKAEETKSESSPDKKETPEKQVAKMKVHETKEYDKSEIKNVVNPQFQSSNLPSKENPQTLHIEAEPQVSTQTVSTQPKVEEKPAVPKQEKEESLREHYEKKFGELKFGSNS